MAKFMNLLNGVARFAAYVTVIIVGIIFVIDLQDQKQTRQDAAIARAWATITNPVLGNAGKGPALEYLYSRGVRLLEIDLSCTSMGGHWDEGEKECQNPVYLSDINLAKTGETAADMRAINLQGVRLWRANLQGADLFHANLEGASLWQANLEGAHLPVANLNGANLAEANLKGADIGHASLIGASLRNANLQGVNIEYAMFYGANLSNADFTGFTDLSKYWNGFGDVWLDTSGAGNAWAWADEPPIGLDLELYKIDLCVAEAPDDHRIQSQRPDPCIPPNGIPPNE